MLACNAMPDRIDPSLIPFGEHGRDLAFNGLSWFLPPNLPMMATDNPTIVRHMVPLDRYISQIAIADGH
jgi:hypothetical protein